MFEKKELIPVLKFLLTKQVGRERAFNLISDIPYRLVCDVASYLEKCPRLPSEMWLKCVRVRYDKGQYVSELPEPDSEEMTSMSYGQKDPKSSGDCEYRLILTLPFTGNSSPPKIGVKLHKRLEYAEIITTIR